MPSDDLESKQQEAYPALKRPFNYARWSTVTSSEPQPPYFQFGPSRNGKSKAHRVSVCLACEVEMTVGSSHSPSTVSRPRLSLVETCVRGHL